MLRRYNIALGIGLVAVVAGIITIGFSINFPRNYYKQYDFVQAGYAPLAVHLQEGWYELYFPAGPSGPFKINSSVVEAFTGESWDSARLQIYNSQDEIVYSSPTYSWTGGGVWFEAGSYSNFTFVAPKSDDYTVSTNKWASPSNALEIYGISREFEDTVWVNPYLVFIGLAVVCAGVAITVYSLSFRHMLKTSST